MTSLSISRLSNLIAEGQSHRETLETSPYEYIAEQAFGAPFVCLRSMNSCTLVLYICSVVAFPATGAHDKYLEQGKSNILGFLFIVLSTSLKPSLAIVCRKPQESMTSCPHFQPLGIQNRPQTHQARINADEECTIKGCYSLRLSMSA